jgi:hypothetical protein
MARVPTTALVASVSNAVSRRYGHQLVWPATWTASTNARKYVTKAPASSHALDKTGLKAPEPVSSSSASLPNHTSARSISAIAQRLPSEAETKTSHRFREFEVCIVASGSYIYGN